MSMHFLTTVQCFTSTHPLEPWLPISTCWLWDTSQNTKDDASFNAAQMLARDVHTCLAKLCLQSHTFF